MWGLCVMCTNNLKLIFMGFNTNIMLLEATLFSFSIINTNMAIT
jgi:hypothetical protein